jgi:GxxExxY protein
MSNMSLRLKSELSDEVEQLNHDVIGAAIEVHRNLGPGFLESINEEALCHELDLREIRYERQKSVTVRYKSIDIHGQRIDWVVGKCLIVELKTVDVVPTIHEARLLSYLETTGIRVGLLINFNSLILKNGLKRMVM